MCHCPRHATGIWFTALLLQASFASALYRDTTCLFPCFASKSACPWLTPPSPKKRTQRFRRKTLARRALLQAKIGCRKLNLFFSKEFFFSYCKDGRSKGAWSNKRIISCCKSLAASFSHNPWSITVTVWSARASHESNPGQILFRGLNLASIICHRIEIFTEPRRYLCVILSRDRDWWRGVR